MNIPVLLWTDPEGRERKVRVIDRVFIGRSCKGVESSKQVIIHDPHVSRDHAVITLMGRNVTITDMSRNGTYLNGIRMAAGATLPLKHNDNVRVGKTEIRIVHTSTATMHGFTQDDAEATYIAPNKIYVTNLVADIRGFTGLTQKLDSQLVSHLLRHTFQSFGDIIQAHHGTLSDFAGDAVYAFWEHPLGLDSDKVLLACQAAKEQENSLEAIRGKIIDNPLLRLVQLKFGWGITTGQVTMSHYTERNSDLVLVGDVTNVAFRLSCMANKQLPGTILLCSKTADLVKDRIPIKYLGSYPIRGRKGEEDVFCLS